MNVAEVIAEIKQAGGEIWAEGERLKFRNIPARLAPAIREHKTALLALLKEGQTGLYCAQAVSVVPEPAMAPQPAPTIVSCRQCVHFQPGFTALGIGVCLATANGLPPKEQRGYLAAYPMAPRRCPEYAGSPS
ncbi:protein of unknown function [Acidithiobacillus ferrivorans]|uniref:TubC N-terminal docking domain-containing protein n=1 Tax=Acidithiobacillus ferrivorans TaxID=160808 RepID=A0A060UUD6_9PROT|nr:hypothetical protein [Acidithiobacillus ferrivorans]CDQ10189.1 hypothetical protein AFERRI_40141 [Acidithiobacillus ferrivorans]SMH64148.1 protein of unknown function [Acidithiobacillus ferrivorans]